MIRQSFGGSRAAYVTALGREGANVSIARGVLGDELRRVQVQATLAGSTPTAAQMADPDLRPLIDRYLPGAKGLPAEERIRTFRLAWDFAGSALASRNEQYERFYLASSGRNMARHLAFTDSSRADRLVDRFLKEPY